MIICDAQFNSTQCMFLSEKQYPSHGQEVPGRAGREEKEPSLEVSQFKRCLKFVEGAEFGVI